VGGDRNKQEREQQPSREDERRAVECGAPFERFVLDVERAASPEQERGDGEVTECLLEVKALEQIEQGEREQQQDRQVECAAAASVQVVGTDQEQRGDRHGERVKDTQLAHRLDVGEHVAAPAHIGCHRRDEVGRRDRRRGKRRQQRQRVGATKGAQRMWAPVQTEPPSCRVAAVTGEIPPILRDQPHPHQHDQRGREAVMDAARKRAKRKRGEHQDAEVPVVPAAAEEVDARPKRVALDPEAPAAFSQPPQTRPSMTVRPAGRGGSTPAIPRAGFSRSG
jgi:hypothetical protein